MKNHVSDKTEFLTLLLFITLKNSSADCQQQVKNTPTNLHDLDRQSNRQLCNTTTVRPLPRIDNYNPYYIGPDFDFDPYWDIQIYNQHH